MDEWTKGLTFCLFVFYLVKLCIWIFVKSPTIFFECEAVTRLYDSVDAEIAILS